MPPDPKVNLLLVDDRPENLLALEAMLGSLDINLVKATSGEEALRRLLDQDFAAILLDVQMPGMDGFETATLIRNRKRTSQTPIIFLTAFETDDSVVTRGYTLGAVDYLFKPINPAILLSKVSVFVDLFKKTDAIQRKTAEVEQQATQLAAINAELRGLFAAMTDVVLVLNAEGQCLKIAPTSPPPLYKPADSLIGQTLHHIFPPPQAEQFLDCIQTTLKTQQPHNIEYQLTIEAQTVWFNANISPIAADAVIWVARDITERKQAEQARTQIIREQTARQEAEAANRMKDEFIAVLSHELRTPLNSILGWAQLLRSKTLDETTIDRALEVIERNATAQAQLIEDILDVSQIIRGKLRLNLCPVDLSVVIGAAIDTVRPLADAKAISLDVQTTTTTVCGDPARLQQVVWNLLSNAIKFTPPGGQIWVRLEHDTPKVWAHGEAAIPPHAAPDYARITVTDTGIGIHPDFLPHVFDRFRQADSTTTRTYNGLGLGLAIVHHLVEMHHGQVWAESPGEGQGATFTIQLPLASRPDQAAADSPNHRSDSDPSSAPLARTATHTASANAPSPVTVLEANPAALDALPLAGRRILVIDDEADIRDFLSFWLEQQGAQAIAVSSAAAALKQLADSPFDLILCDIAMPEMDGHTLIQQIRHSAAQPAIPAIALSAHTGAATRQQALASGFQLYLSKPVEPKQLLAAITQLFNEELN
ncbi:MAG: response regulator [Synechococcales cyanobacterium C42_A2020_086]|jgi:signal transduction histidine kinase/DNA-binding response OmpR family regulator|nr:response regulator [Synechococcales cyanobacterium C42_A2020_086]